MVNKKKIFRKLLINSLFLILLILSINFLLASSFSSTWNTSKLSTGSSNATTISLPIYSGGTYNFTVNWGDGTVENVTSYLQNNHTYATEGTYTVNITGTIIGFRFNNIGDRNKIQNITQWGNLTLGSNGGYFYGCSNLTSSATDAPNMAGASLYRIFRSATLFNGNISNWNISGITSLEEAFSDAKSFNSDLSSWDTSSITTLRYAFAGAISFNRNISSWNTSNVNTIYNTFNGATSFNQDINNWDTSKVTTMSSLFYLASSFNQNLSNWNTCNVTDMNYMFQEASSFNGNISTWNTSKVTLMGSMFRSTPFNQDISNWNTSSVTTMSSMFRDATAFNQDISNWDTSKVGTMYEMFRSATSFNQDISNWDTSKVGTMYNMFSGSTSFNQNIGNWNVSNVSNMQNMFSGVTLSTANYDSLLQGWSSRFEQNNTIFNGGNSKYSNCAGTGNESRNILINTYNWSIVDGGWNSSYVCPIDTSYPQFFDYWSNNGSLTKSGTGLFNITLLNTNGTVLLEINGQNITATNKSGNGTTFNATYSFFSAGTYSYKWHSWGNGTDALFNSSDIKSYVVKSETATSSNSGGSASYFIEQKTTSPLLTVRFFTSPNIPAVIQVSQDKGTGIKEIELNSKNWLSGEILITAYNETPSFCYIDYSDSYLVYLVLNFSSTIKNDSLNSGRLKIGISNYWISSNNISGIKFVKCSPEYKEVNSSYNSKTNEEGLYNVYLTGFSTYAILGTLEESKIENLNEEPNDNFTSSNIWSWILTIIIIVVAIIVILFIVKKHK
jgi:surface protein